jgi:outer membrane protein
MKQLFSVLLALTAIAVLAVTSPLFAQSADVPHTLTLDAAIKAAIDRNYDVRRAGNTSRRSEIEVTRSKDAFLPSASASGNYGYTYSLAPLSARTQISGGDTLSINGVSFAQPMREVILPAGSHSLSWDAGANFNIYNGGADIARVRAAEASLEGSRDQFTWSRQEIAYSTISSYINVLRTKELVASAQQSLAEALAQLELIRGKYQAGVVPIGQVYQQQAVVGQDSLSLIQARNNFENAKTDVLFLLNVPPTDFSQYTFTVGGVDTSVATKNIVDTTLPIAAIDEAAQNRPDIQAQRMAIEAQGHDIDITRAALLPRLDASAGIGGSGANEELSKIHVSNRLNAGLSLNIPIFDRMQNRLLIEEQEVDLENQRIELERTTQQMRSDAAKAVNNLHAASEALSATQTAVTAANESLRLAQERMRVGAGTQVDVVIAEAAVETARTNYVNAKFNYVLAQRQLAFTLGPWNY